MGDALQPPVDSQGAVKYKGNHMFWRKKSLTPDQMLNNALAASNLAEATRLLDAGASANACDHRGRPLIASACSSRWQDAVQLLVDHGADVNVVVHSEKPRINHAPVLNLPAANGSVAIASALLQAGARVNAADATGVTALMAASYMGHADVVSLLLAHGAQLEQTDECGYTALMFASNAGHAAVVRALLAAGANPHATDKQSSTPLMFAAQHAHDQIVQELLRVGADPTVLGSHGLSAIGFARQNGHASTLQLLMQSGDTQHLDSP